MPETIFLADDPIVQAVRSTMTCDHPVCIAGKTLRLAVALHVDVCGGDIAAAISLLGLVAGSVVNAMQSGDLIVSGGTTMSAKEPTVAGTNKIH